MEGLIIEPLSRTLSPRPTSRPAIRISLPSDTSVKIPIESSSFTVSLSISVVSSKGTTASAPGGIGAPVIILEAFPGPILTFGKDPAAMVSNTSRKTGLSAPAPSVSPAITA